MDIPFTKMHGLGNDFVLIEEDQVSPDIDFETLAKDLCDRHFGIGADGLIVVAPAENSDCDIQFKFWNNDGSRSEMCGNGIRCFARYVRDQGLIRQDGFKVETMGVVVVPHIKPGGLVTVDMGPPFLQSETIPFIGGSDSPVLSFPLEIDGTVIPINAVGMGNPHCVIFQQDLSAPLDWKALGPKIEYNQLFPAKTNVEFVEIINRHTVQVNVWERGVGPTLACGSGACAVAVAGILRNLIESPVSVNLPGGSLNIEWNGQGNVLMTGPASYVFVGTFPYQARKAAVH